MINQKKMFLSGLAHLGVTGVKKPASGESPNFLTIPVLGKL